MHSTSWADLHARHCNAQHLHGATCPVLTQYRMCTTQTAVHSQHQYRTMPCTALEGQSYMHSNYKDSTACAASTACTALHAQHCMHSTACAALHGQHFMLSTACTALHAPPCLDSTIRTILVVGLTVVCKTEERTDRQISRYTDTSIQEALSCFPLPLLVL